MKKRLEFEFVDAPILGVVDVDVFCGLEYILPLELHGFELLLLVRFVLEGNWRMEELDPEIDDCVTTGDWFGGGMVLVVDDKLSD